MRKIICLIGSILFTLLWACEKEDAGLPLSNSSGLLYQVKFDGELYAEYTYTKSNQIAEEKSKMHYTRHNYQHGKLISSDYYLDPGMFSSNSSTAESARNREEWVHPTNTQKNSTKTYAYDEEGRISKSVNELGACAYHYDDKNRINRQTFYRDNERTGYIDYTYDANDNVIKRRHYWLLATGEAELQTTTVYEVDNKNNPYSTFNSLLTPGRYTNTNNIIKQTYTIHHEVAAGIDKVQVTQNRYTYNTRGYPTSKNESVRYFYY